MSTNLSKYLNIKVCVEKIFLEGKFFIASKISRYETGYWYLSAQLQNFFGSRGIYGVTADFGGTNFFMWSNFNRGATEFFLFHLDGGKVRGGRKNESRTSKARNVDWLDTAVAYGIRGVGGCRKNFDATFYCVGKLSCSFLRNFAGSFGVSREEVNLWSISVSVRL